MTPYPTAPYKSASPNDLKRNYKKQMIPVPNSKVDGSSEIYRNAISKDGLIVSPPDSTTVYEAFEHGLKIAGKGAPCLAKRPLISKKDAATGVPVWAPYAWQSFGQVQERRLNFGSGLVKLHGETGGGIDDQQWTFGIYAINRPEWFIADHAGYAYNLVPVALFDTLGPESVEFILNHADMSVIVCSLDKVQNVLKVANKCPQLKVIISMDPLNEGNAQGVSENQYHAISGMGASAGAILKHWASEKGVKLLDFTEVEAIGKANRFAPRPPKPEDLATICYTSGTTGNPKGALTTHANYLAASGSLMSLGISFTPEDMYLSYLPLAHSYERLNLVGLVYCGVPIAFYRGDVSLLFEDIATIRPTLFCSVPRLFNRIHAAILQKTLYSGSTITAALFKRALDAKTLSIKNSGSLTNALWDRLIFNKIKMVLGGRVKLMVSGSAPIASDVLSFLRCCFSCQVLEGFGQTETAAACSISWIGDYRAGGTIGPIMTCAEVKLVDIPDMKYLSTDSPFPRGEICVRGGNVMKGYHKDPEKTAEAIDQDGWLHTGDVGLIDKRGLIRIIDRKKHIFKLSQGEYVAPEKLENVFISSGYVAQLFIHGDSLEDSLVAVIVPDPEFSVKQAIAHKILSPKTTVPGPLAPGQPLPEILQTLCKDDRFKKLVADDLAAIGKSKKLAGFEFPKAIYLEPKVLMTIENGLLTPTLKLKRDYAREVYGKEIEKMYATINARKSIADEARKAKL